MVRTWARALDEFGLREELEGNGLNGHSEHDDEAKRPRTD